MGTEETCSALCVMSDPDKVVFARSEKFGNATHVIVWDLLGNQALKEVKYDAPVGNNDYVNFLKLSHNDRYCVLGFNNSFDNHAEFVVFDMNQTHHEVTDPCLLRLDANTDCTVIDQNQKFSLISQCAFSYMALVLVFFCKVDEKAYWFSRAKMIHTNQ